MAADRREIRMGPYALLNHYLEARAAEDVIRLTFDEIEGILGQPLPVSAFGEQWWTANPKSAQARAWLKAWRSPTRTGNQVAFVRITQLVQKDMRDSAEFMSSRVEYLRRVLSGGYVWQDDVDRRYWEPFRVYLIHFDEIGLYKVGLTRADTSRVAHLIKPGGELVEDVVVANKTAAMLLELLSLQSMAPHRSEPPLWVAQWTGAAEFWRDEVQLEPLRDQVARLAGDADLVEWDRSYLRDV